MDEKKTEEKRQWYVVNTYAGHENRVKENLERRIKTMGMEENLFQVVVAEETEIDYKEKNGKPGKVTKTRNMFPGYIFVEAEMKGDVAHTLRFMPNVLGFLGGLDNPSPVKQSEINRMLGNAEETEIENEVSIPYEVNETVKVTEGPFSGFSGVIEEVNVEKAPETAEIQNGDVYIHNILGTENSKWEVRRKTDKGYKVLGKYAYEKAKHYASQFGPIKEA